MGSIRDADSLFDGLIIGLLLPGPLAPRDIFQSGTLLKGRRGLAPYTVRSIASLAVSASVADLGPFDPVLKQKIAGDVALTLAEEPDKRAASPATDLLAYYVAPQGLTNVTFLAQYQWGIVLPTGGIEYLARFLVDEQGFSLDSALIAATAMLHGHEYFHHLVAASAALMERHHRSPGLYADYRSRADGPRGYCELEEALANAFAARALAEHPQEQQALLAFSARQPKGYDRASQYMDDDEFRAACVDLLALVRNVPDRDLDLADILLLDVLNDYTGERLGSESAQMYTLDSKGSAHQASEWRLGL